LDYKNQGTGHYGSVGPRRSGRGNTLAEPRGAAAINNVGGHCSERVAGERLKKMKKRRDNWCRLLGTSSLKEGAV
jgi:hypothetical protein